MSNWNRRFPAVFAGLLLLAVSAAAQPPAITPQGIVNAASLMPPSLTGGKLAPGMEIVIPGIRFVAPNSDPVVQLEQGSWRASVKPRQITPQMLKAKLPANTPLGEIEISVMNVEGSSRPQKATVVASSPGIATVNGEGWGPATADTVTIGQRITLEVNGLNESSPKVFVAGKPVHGVEVRGTNVSFRVPRGTPVGCWTPAWIESQSGTISNFVTLSVGKQADACEQAPGWFARRMPSGTRTGLVVLERISGTVEETGKPLMFAFDSGAAFFFRAAQGKLVPLQLLPPNRSCTSYTGTFSFDAASLLDLQQFIGSASAQLDAGPSVTVESDSGFRNWLKTYGRTQGAYTAFFGGTLPIMWGPGTDLVLKPGPYRIQTSGERSDFGKLSLTLAIPRSFDWINSSSIQQIDRSAGLTLQWKNLSSDRQMMAMAFNVDQETGAMASLVCVAAPKATEIKIPPAALADFPPTRPNGTLPLRFILLASLPAASPEQPPPSGLDDARAIFLEIQGKTVRYR